MSVTVSANSVPSLPSSLSLDSRTDESQPSLVFMRDFIEVLFADSGAITLDLKSEFGSRARVLQHILLLHIVIDLFNNILGPIL